MLELDLETPGLHRLLSAEAPLDRIYHGMTFGEGPVWNRRDGSAKSHFDCKQFIACFVEYQTRVAW